MSRVDLATMRRLADGDSDDAMCAIAHALIDIAESMRPEVITIETKFRGIE